MSDCLELFNVLQLTYTTHDYIIIPDPTTTGTAGGCTAQ